MTHELPEVRATVRVAQVTPSLLYGGLERLVRDLALGVGSAEFETAVFTVKGLGTYASDLREAGIQVVDCTEGRVRVRGMPIRLLRALRRFRPDVVHAHSGTWLPAALAGQLLGNARLVFTDHGRYPPEPRARALVERWCLRRTDRLVAVSQPLADYLRDFLGLEEAPPVITNGVDLEAFGRSDPAERARLRAGWGAADDALVLLLVGRLEPVKNVDGLLRAVARAGLPALRVVLLGKGGRRAELEGLATSLGLRDRVVFAGFRSDVAACLAAADLYALPSHTEGTPLSLLEAMATGLPTVASAVGGVPGVLGEPPAGILVEPGDDGALAAALGRLAADAGLRRELGARARERARAYGLDAFVERYAALYRDLTDRSGR